MFPDFVFKLPGGGNYTLPISGSVMCVHILYNFNRRFFIFLLCRVVRGPVDVALTAAGNFLLVCQPELINRHVSLKKKPICLCSLYGLCIF